jgi:hypothetical protein
LRPATWTMTDGVPGAQGVDAAAADGRASVVAAANMAAPPITNRTTDLDMLFPTASL